MNPLRLRLSMRTTGSPITNDTTNQPPQRTRIPITYSLPKGLKPSIPDLVDSDTDTDTDSDTSAANDNGSNIVSDPTFRDLFGPTESELTTRLETTLHISAPQRYHALRIVNGFVEFDLKAFSEYWTQSLPDNQTMIQTLYDSIDESSTVIQQKCSFIHCIERLIYKYYSEMHLKNCALLRSDVSQLSTQILQFCISIIAERRPISALLSTSAIITFDDFCNIGQILTDLFSPSLPTLSLSK